MTRPTIEPEESLEDALALGRPRAAIERVLFDLQRFGRSYGKTHFADRILKVVRTLGGRSSGAFLDGVLYVDDRDHGHEIARLRQLVQDLFRDTRMDHEYAEEVAPLFSKALAQVGVALFPIVSEATSRGALRALVVGPRLAEMRHPPQPGFAAAVENARRLAARCADSHLLREARWSLTPDLPSNAQLDRRSVELAAFVAFTSYALQRRVPPERAFTGAYEESDVDTGAFTVGSMATHEIGVKHSATAQRAQVRILHTPRFHERIAEPRASAMLDPTDSWKALLFTVLDVTGEELFRQAPARRSSTPRSSASPHAELLRRIEALLHASPDPLPLRAIEQALLADAWTSPSALGLGEELSELLNELENGGGIERIAIREPHHPSWRATNGTLVHTLQRGRAAHLALAQAAERDPAHLASRRLVIYHRAAADDLDTARNEIVALARSTSADSIATIVDVLQMIARNGHADRALALASLLGAAQTTAGGLACAAFLCSQLPHPFAALTARLGRCSSHLDRLLWLQAVLETALHFLAACALVLEDESPGRALSPHAVQRRRDVARRPSLGSLFDQVAVLGDLPPFDDPLRAALSKKLARSPLVDRGETSVKSEVSAILNHTLHHFGGWQNVRLNRPAARHTHRLEGGQRATGWIDEVLGTVSRRLTPALEHLRDTFASFELRPVPTVGSTARPNRGYALARKEATIAEPSLDLRNLLLDISEAADGSDVGFYRGVIDGSVRYWSLATGRARRARGLESVPPERLLSDRELLTELTQQLEDDDLACHDSSTPRSCNVSLLPRPLAIVAVALRRATHAFHGDPGLSVSELLSTTDLALGLMLRLVCFGVCPPKLGSASVPLIQRTWLSRMTKRSLLEQILQRLDDGSLDGPRSALAEFLDRDGARAKLWRAIDLLERLEHAAGPLAENGALVQAASARVAEVLARSPFADGSWRLVARTGAVVTDLTGLTSRLRASPARPRDEAVEVVLEGAPGSICLWPFIVARGPVRDATDILVLAEVKRPKATLAGQQPTYMSVAGSLDVTFCSARWRLDPTKPRDVDIDLTTQA